MLSSSLRKWIDTMETMSLILVKVEYDIMDMQVNFSTDTT